MGRGIDDVLRKDSSFFGSGGMLVLPARGVPPVLEVAATLPARGVPPALGRRGDSVLLVGDGSSGQGERTRGRHLPILLSGRFSSSG